MTLKYAFINYIHANKFTYVYLSAFFAGILVSFYLNGYLVQAVADREGLTGVNIK